MEINYSLTEQDYIHYNIYHLHRSPTFKKSLLVQRYLIPLIFLIMPFTITKFTDIPFWYWSSVFGLTTILWMAFYPKYFKWVLTRRILKMLKEGQNKRLLGERTLSLSPQGILEKSVYNQEKTLWPAVESIEETEDYTFIYIDSISAYIVPTRAFDSKEHKEEFLVELQKYTRCKQ